VPDFALALRAMKTAAVAALFATLIQPFTARAETPAPVCNTSLELVRLTHPLQHVAQKLSGGDALTIVAIGSSSTAGAGASSPAKNYPNQLALYLRNRFPKTTINMINRGVNGEEVGDMLQRFDQVIAAKPDLVLWQLGTNSVVRDHQISDHGAAIRAGVARIRASGADVVLINPQYAPKVIVRPEAAPMIDLIATSAKLENVDLFHRYEVMKHWYNDEHIKFESFVSADGLHMNDWSYACFAQGLGVAIAEAAERPVMSATAGSRPLP